MGQGNNNFSHQQRHDLYIIVAVESLIGIVLNLFTVYTFFRFNDLRKVRKRVDLYIWKKLPHEIILLLFCAFNMKMIISSHITPAP
jgi:hypothetical protein